MSDLLAFQFAIERGDPGSVMCSYNRVNGDYRLRERLAARPGAARRLRLSRLCDDRLGRGAQHDEGRACNGLDQESRLAVRRRALSSAPLAEAAIAAGHSAGGAARRNGDAHSALDVRARRSSTIRSRQARRSTMPAHEAVSQADAEQAIVLLKNDGNLLPLGAERAAHRGHRRPCRQGRARRQRLVAGLSARRQCRAGPRSRPAGRGR